MLAHNQHATEGVELMRSGISEAQAIGNKLDAFAFAMLAEGLTKAGALDEALRTIDEALSSKREQVTWQGCLLWLRGEILTRTFSYEASSSTPTQRITSSDLLTRAGIAYARPFR